MWKLYEIDGFLAEAISAAEQSIDQETGEIPEDWAAFLDEVQGERDAKALNVARYIKSLDSEGKAIEVEEKKLRDRRTALKNKAERIKSWLSSFVHPGEKLSDAVSVISWRKSKSVCVLDELAVPDDYCKIERKPVKSLIKEAIERGDAVEWAEIRETQNIQVK